jgi:hypothetical protein
MKTLTGLHATILIVVHSLFPGAGGEPPRPHPAEAHPTVIPVNDISSYIASLRHGTRSLDLLFFHAYGIAAPFFLFRLKRLGFSNCRVVVTPDGLRVTADR